tara:strand:+ start:2360 stop:2551 length:192 start_codon:yes stop_codon:yes gene_type:complete
MSDIVTEFNAYRERMNAEILADNNKVIKRIFNLDTNAYAKDSSAGARLQRVLINYYLLELTAS